MRRTHYTMSGDKPSPRSKVWKQFKGYCGKTGYRGTILPQIEIKVTKDRHLITCRECKMKLKGFDKNSNRREM